MKQRSLPKIRKHKWVEVSKNLKVCQCCGLKQQVVPFPPFKGINGGWVTKHQVRGSKWTMNWVPRCNAILEGAL
jgi:hypothetical protein